MWRYLLKEEDVLYIRRLRPVLGVLGLLSLMLSGCAFDSVQSTLDPIGPVAKVQYDLLIFTTILSLIVCAGVGLALYWVMTRFRRRQGDTSVPDQGHGNPALEVTLISIATILTVIVAIPSVKANFDVGKRLEPTPDGNEIVINVTGYQWWWSFEYPDLGIVTANEIHVPKDRKVILKLESADVLHSFWIPKIGGKTDLIPNQHNSMWLDTEGVPAGVYYGQCAELCLGAHAYMHMRFVVDEDADYDSWVASFQNEQTKPLNAIATDAVAVQADPLVDAGKVLFKQKGCAACHAVGGYSVGQIDKPNLTNFGLRTSIAAGVSDMSQENLEAWLKDPQAVKPTNRMPTLWSSDDPNRDTEVTALATYLRSLGVQNAPQAMIGGSHGN
jgi:cytochrome c oxidase subunit II